MLFEFSRPDLCDPAEEQQIQTATQEGGQYVDDLKGEILDTGLTHAARMEEISVFRERRVYDILDKAQLPRGAKVVGARWVDTNKGTDSQPRIRSRLVCQDFNFGGDGGEMSAPTPR